MRRPSVGGSAYQSAAGSAVTEPSQTRSWISGLSESSLARENKRTRDSGGTGGHRAPVKQRSSRPWFLVVCSRAVTQAVRSQAVVERTGRG